MYRPVFPASCAILCPANGMFYCRPRCLNTAIRQQEGFQYSSRENMEHVR
jgi:hypothetical protein